MTTSTALENRWIDLDGVVNMRDCAGIPTGDGRTVQPHRLIRSDNLQELSDADVAWLLDEAGLTDVIDLRTGVEVRGEGPGPLTRTPVTIHHLTMFPEGANETGIPDDDEQLPWLSEERDPVDPQGRHEWHLLQTYLGYLTQRPDNVTEALRVIAHAPGAVVVHCAAGKDRTGTIVALALHLAGVSIEDAAADYDASTERVERILQRLRPRPTYAEDMADQTPATQNTPYVVIADLLTHIDEQWGGIEPYLERQGWTPEDTEALRSRLLDA